MGNNLPIEQKSQKDSKVKISNNYRWYVSETLISEPGEKYYKPLPIDLSLKIEESYQKNQFYESKKDNIMIFFDFENQKKHILINQDDAWKQKEVIRINILSEKNEKITKLSPRLSKNFNIEQICHFDTFPAAFSNQLCICPYNKIFEKIDYDKSDNFLCQFMKFSILIDKNFMKYLTEDFNMFLLEKLKGNLYNMNPDANNYHTHYQLSFKEFKHLLIKGLKFLDMKDFNSYTYYFENLTKDNFTTTIIKMFNEDGSLYKVILNFIKNKSYKSNKELLLFYLSLMFSLNYTKIQSIHEKMYLYPKKKTLSSFEQNTYYYLNEGFICTKANIENVQRDKQKIEIIYNNNSLESDKFPFLTIKPFEIGKVFSLYNDEEIFLPNNSILKCIEVNEDVIKFEIILDLISNQVAYMRDQDKKQFYIYDDISVISNTFLFFEREIYPNVKYAKLKPKNYKFIAKFLSYGNTLESIDCYGAGLTYSNLSDIFRLYTESPGVLKYLDLSGNEICDKGLNEFNKCLPNLANTLESLNLGFNAISDDLLTKISFHLLPNLKYLFLKENNINSEGAKYLAQQFKYCKKLIVLDLYDNLFGDEGIIEISKEIHELVYLRKIDLFHCSIKNKGIKVFLNSIMCLSKHLNWINLKQNEFGKDEEIVNQIIQVKLNFDILYFNFEQNCLTESEIFQISQNLDNNENNLSQKSTKDSQSSKKSFQSNKRSNKSLKKRNYFHTSPNINISSLGGFKYFLQNLDKYSQNVKSINFSEYEKQDDFPQASLKHLFLSALTLQNLTSLNFNFCSNLSQVSLNIILSNLSTFENLTELSLNSIDLTNKLDVFNNNMSQLCRIEKLSLCYNDIDELFIFETLENFSYLISIKHIDLYGNLINNEGMKLFCSALKVQNNITYLNFGKNLIGNEGIRSLGECFKYLNKLKWLDLSSNLFEDDAMRIFLSNFAYLLGLDRFDIRNNNISQKITNLIMEQGVPKNFLV